VLGVIYLRSPLRPTEPTRGTGPLVAGVVCALATIVIGVYPQPVFDLAKSAAPHGKVGVTAPTAK
jgi:NADH:ubiquinone oxidoreductase subunit 2 (subunit N)